MSELVDLAAGIVGRAAAGEHLEVYVAKGAETEVRSYRGEVESLTSATTSGIGVRVLVASPDGARVGFASAGALSDDVIDTVLAEARDNARFATPDEFVVFATPDGVARPDLVLEDAGLASSAGRPKDRTRDRARSRRPRR